MTERHPPPITLEELDRLLAEREAAEAAEPGQRAAIEAMMASWGRLERDQAARERRAG